MKRGKKEFVYLREKIKRNNKIIIGILSLFVIYAVVHSICILDCNNSFKSISDKSYSCTKIPNDLYKFLNNNYMTISIVLLVIAGIFLIIQKIELLKINKLDTGLLDEEKVYKRSHIIITLLFGYTGIHKFRTENRPIGYIYLLNFMCFVITWLIKSFFNETFNKYSIIRVIHEFSTLFIIGIIILCIIEAVFSLITKKDDEDRIFA